MGASGGARDGSQPQREGAGPSREEVNRPQEPSGHQAPISDEAGAFARGSASEGLDPADKAHIDTAINEAVASDLRSCFPPLFGRALGYQSDLMRPAFPVKFSLRSHLAWYCLVMNGVC
jgi:hypothetical protein